MTSLALATAGPSRQRSSWGAGHSSTSRIAGRARRPAPASPALDRVTRSRASSCPPSTCGDPTRQAARPRAGRRSPARATSRRARRSPRRSSDGPSRSTARGRATVRQLNHSRQERRRSPSGHHCHETPSARPAPGSENRNGTAHRTRRVSSSTRSTSAAHLAPQRARPQQDASPRTEDRRCRTTSTSPSLSARGTKIVVAQTAAAR